jgi:hypothetical protein
VGGSGTKFQEPRHHGTTPRGVEDLEFRAAMLLDDFVPSRRFSVLSPPLKDGYTCSDLEFLLWSFYRSIS